jgi:hypothetical protein
MVVICATTPTLAVVAAGSLVTPPKMVSAHKRSLWTFDPPSNMQLEACRDPSVRHGAALMHTWMPSSKGCRALRALVSQSKIRTKKLWFMLFAVEGMIRSGR